MRKFKVQSETNPDNSYIVRIFDSGKSACKCLDYTFGKTGYECKHIVKTRRYIKGDKVEGVEEIYEEKHA